MILIFIILLILIILLKLIKTHKLNFTNIDYLKKLLKENNFEILFIEENKNFAIYKNENPICIRVICKKL